MLSSIASRRRVPQAVARATGALAQWEQLTRQEAHCSGKFEWLGAASASSSSCSSNGSGNSSSDSICARWQPLPHLPQQCTPAAQQPLPHGSAAPPAQRHRLQASAVTLRQQYSSSAGSSNSTSTSKTAGSSSAAPAAATPMSSPTLPTPPSQSPLPPMSPDVADLPAKLALLEAAGIPREGAHRRYAPFLCSPAHHIAVRLGFLRSRGKLRHPPRLWQVICPSDVELCRLHGESEQELQAFKQQYLASQDWHQFCQRHDVQQAQPPPQQQGLES